MEVPESSHYLISFEKNVGKQRIREISRMTMIEEMLIENGLELVDFAPGFGPISFGWIVDMKAVTFTRVLGPDDWEEHSSKYPLLGDFSVLLQILESKKGRVGAKRLGLLD
jgi:hypothetical protein